MARPSVNVCKVYCTRIVAGAVWVLTSATACMRNGQPTPGRPECPAKCSTTQLVSGSIRFLVRHCCRASMCKGGSGLIAHDAKGGGIGQGRTHVKRRGRADVRDRKFFDRTCGGHSAQYAMSNTGASRCFEVLRRYYTARTRTRTSRSQHLSAPRIRTRLAGTQRHEPKRGVAAPSTVCILIITFPPAKMLSNFFA